MTGLDLSSVEMGLTEHVGLVRRLRFDGFIEHREDRGRKMFGSFRVAEFQGICD